MVISATTRLRSTPYKRVVISERALQALFRTNPKPATVDKILKEAQREATNGEDLEALQATLLQFDLNTEIVDGRIAILSQLDLEKDEAETIQKRAQRQPQKGKEVKRGNIFNLGYKIIDAKTAGRSGLGIFLENDQEGNAFVKIWEVDEGTGSIAFKRYGKRRWIHGFKGIDKLYTVIIQERLQGKDVKRLYAWSDKESWGDLDHAEIIYTLAQKTSTGWKIFDKPRTTESLSVLQKTNLETTKMISYLLKKQGKHTFPRDWLIRHRGKAEGYIAFVYQGKAYYISGFGDRERIHMVISEELNNETKELEKIARFCDYDRSNQNKPTHDYIGVYRLARNTNTGWELIHPPDPIESVSEVQQSRKAAKELKQFLETDQVEEAEIPIPPQTVHSHGYIRLHFVNQFRDICNLSDFIGREVFGVIRQENGHKRAFLWLNPARGDKNRTIPKTPPLKPDGDIIAAKGNGSWKIITTVSPALAEARKETALYAQHILVDHPGEIHPSWWTIYRVASNRNQGVKKRLFGKDIKFYCPKSDIIGLSRLLGVNRQLADDFKIIEFYRDEESIEAGVSPIRIGLLAYKLSGRWYAFDFDIFANTPLPVRALPDKILLNLFHDEYLRKNLPEHHAILKTQIENYYMDKYPAPLARYYLYPNASPAS